MLTIFALSLLRYRQKERENAVLPKVNNPEQFPQNSLT